MGILTELGSSGLVGNQTAELLEYAAAADTDRGVVLEVENHTKSLLEIVTLFHGGGDFVVSPSQTIPPGARDRFSAQDCGSLAGVEGGIVYKSPANFRVHLRWLNPVVGSTEVSVRTSGEKGAAYEATATCRSGKNAHIKCDVREILDPKFAREPDYIWAHLHGYAIAPDNVYEYPLIPLHTWWSARRGDHWSTTNLMYTDPLWEKLSPDYEHCCIEGYIIAPDISPVPDRVLPLHTWWSPTLEDSFATTWSGWTQPVVRDVHPDYLHYRFEGYLFSPDYPAPADTVPINHWFSQSRNDNLITSQRWWRPE